MDRQFAGTHSDGIETRGAVIGDVRTDEDGNKSVSGTESKSMVHIRWPSSNGREIRGVPTARRALKLEPGVQSEVWETAPEHLRTLRRMLLTAQSTRKAAEKQEPPAG